MHDARLLGGEEFIQRGSSRSSASRTSASLMSPIDWRASAPRLLHKPDSARLDPRTRHLFEAPKFLNSEARDAAAYPLDRIHADIHDAEHHHSEVGYIAA
jgi:hypothetical protein